MRASNENTVGARSLPYLLVLLAVMLAGSAGLVAAGRGIGKAAAEAEEAGKPAEVQVLRITAPSCDGCPSLDAFLEQIGTQPVEKTAELEVAYDSDRGKELVAKYGIDRVPALVVTGETDKANVAAFFSSKTSAAADGAVWNDVPPPYVEVATGEVRGAVRAAYVVDGGCDLCAPIDRYLESVRGAGVSVGDADIVDTATAEGRAYVEGLALGTVPALILEGDLGVYPGFAERWQGIGGTVADDGTYAIEPRIAPYRDLAARRTVGLVGMTFLTDGSCEECYDPTGNRDILSDGYGVAIAREHTVDASSAEGLRLIRRYGIEAVPTFILTSDAKEYPDLAAVWPAVGTTEDDGVFVFRTLAALGDVKYRDLGSGRIVSAAEAAQEAAAQAEAAEAQSADQDTP